MLTTASEAGVDLAGIMRQSGHASTSVALGYIRPVEQARNPAARVQLVSDILDDPFERRDDVDLDELLDENGTSDAGESGETPDADSPTAESAELDELLDADDVAPSEGRVDVAPSEPGDTSVSQPAAAPSIDDLNAKIAATTTAKQRRQQRKKPGGLALGLGVTGIVVGSFATVGGDRPGSAGRGWRR